MRKPSRYAKRKLSSSAKPDKSKLDLFFQRAVWVVQLLLFPLAIVGYIFTVRPVYQKQLVDEKIAERTVLLVAATRNVKHLSNEQARLVSENKALADDAERTYGSLKANVLNSLPMLGTNCAYTAQITGAALFSCINKQVLKEVIEPLRNADRERVHEVLNKHRIEIVSIPDNLDKEQRNAEAKKAREIKRLDRIVKGFPRDAISKIHKLRGGAGIAPSTIAELGKLTNDEVNIHNASLDASRTALMDITFEKLQGVGAGGPGYQISTKLGEVLRRVRDAATENG